MSKRITTAQIGELVAQDKAERVTRDDLDAFLKNPGLWRAAATAATVEAAPPEIVPTVGPSFKFKGNYALTLAAMIALGKYGAKHPLITGENFPHDNTLGEVEIEATYCIYRRKINAKAVVADLDARGMRPAAMVELLAFGAAFPEEQRKFPILALGSVFSPAFGYRCIGLLRMDGSRRALELERVDFIWILWRFLTVSLGQNPYEDARWEETKLRFYIKAA